MVRKSLWRLSYLVWNGSLDSDGGLVAMVHKKGAEPMPRSTKLAACHREQPAMFGIIVVEGLVPTAGHAVEESAIVCLPLRPHDLVGLQGIGFRGVPRNSKADSTFNLHGFRSRHLLGP